MSDRDELRKRRDRTESSPQGGFGDASTIPRELGTPGTYEPVLPAGAPAWTLQLLQQDTRESGAVLAVYTLVAGVFHNPRKAAHLSADELDVLVNWYLQHWNDRPVQKPRMTVMLGAYDPTLPRDEPALTRVPPDLFTVQAHGSEAGSSATVLDQDFQPLAARQVAEDILANPSYAIGQPVLLVVCQVGRNAPYIQQIADYLSAPVYAYAVDVPVDARGNPTAFSDEAAFGRARRSMDPSLILYSPGAPSP